MERGFGGEWVSGFPGAEVGGYIFGCFLAFFSACFFGVVFRESWDVFFGFRVPLGVSRGVSRTSFLEEFREFSNFGGGSKSIAGAMF